MTHNVNEMSAPHMSGTSSDPSPQSSSKSQRQRIGMHRPLPHWKSPANDCNCS